jgi:hypothetical protein
VITQTSFEHLVGRAALFDELEKIAEASPDAAANRDKFKKWLKNSAIVAAGAGAGTAATMVVDKLLGDKLGKAWQGISPATKMLIIGPLVGLSVMGASYGGHKVLTERKKTEA